MRAEPFRLTARSAPSWGFGSKREDRGALLRTAVVLVLATLPVFAHAQALPALTSTETPGGGTTYSLTIQTLLQWYPLLPVFMVT